MSTKLNFRCAKVLKWLQFGCLGMCLWVTASNGQRLAAADALAERSIRPKFCQGFLLRDVRGKSHSLAELKQPLKVLAFLGTECPLAQLYAPRLNKLAGEYSDQVAFLGLNSNCQDSLTEMAAYAKRLDLQFPLLKDVANQVADQVGAQRTPEVVLLDAENRIRYRGRIDDQYSVGVARAKAERHDLRNAIVALIEGRDVPIPETVPVGCFIGRLPSAIKNTSYSKSGEAGSGEAGSGEANSGAPNSGQRTKLERRPDAVAGSITYTQHVAGILQQHCVECHRAGQIAPFALTDYEEVIGWGETIREVIADQRMPPWHANPQHGQFTNARVMPNVDKQQLFQWLDAGMPRGEKTSSMPPIPEVAAGWRLPREPDQVIAMSERPFRVAAEGTVEYQYFVADPGFTEDRWISAAEVVPGNRSVVHHAIVFIRPPEGERQDGIGWLTAYVPGQTIMVLPDGMARRVPAGSKLVFQMHYTPNGSPQDDVTQVGLIFADRATIDTEVQTRIVIDRDFEIPPGVDDYSVSMFADEFPAGSRLMAIAPHMHYRGSQFRVSATVGEKSNILLDVPNYDFNWQHAYLLKHPIPLQGTRIDCVATFDNSADNLANPDPMATVRWGDQTWEEMALAYLEVAIPLKPTRATDTPTAKDAPSTDDRKQAAARVVAENNGRKRNVDAETRERLAQESTKAFFAKLDTNGDQEILRAETPKSFRVFAFRHFDVNEDDKLTWEEVLRQARISQQPQR